MSVSFPELDAVRVQVGAPTQERHLSVIESALRATARPGRRRFRLMAVAVAILLLLPVIALAAERTGPGDFLYPVRQILESVTDARPLPDAVPPAVGIPGDPSDSDASETTLTDRSPISTRGTSDRAEGSSTNGTRDDAGDTSDGTGERGTDRGVTDGDTSPERDRAGEGDGVRRPSLP